MQTWLYLLIAAGAGVLMALQGSLNGALSKIIGTLEGSFAVHLLGLVTVALLLFVCGLGRGDLSRAELMGRLDWEIAVDSRVVRSWDVDGGVSLKGEPGT